MIKGKLSRKTYGLYNFMDYRRVWPKVVYGLFILFMLTVVVVSVLPPISLFFAGFKNPQDIYSVPFKLLPESFDFSKIAKVWTDMNFGKYFVNSVIVIAGALVCSIVFNGLLAYATAIVKPAGHKVVYSLVLGSMMIPAVLSIVPLFNQIVKLQLTNKHIALWLAAGANAYHFVLFHTYFKSLPKSLMEAARLDGCSKLTLFYRIVAPLSAPIIGVVAIFTLNATWSDFLLPFLVLKQDATRTVMVKIFDMQSNMSTSAQFGMDYLLVVLSISMIPPIALFIIFQKQITGSVSTSGMKD
ncbi:MAG: carbohydrate ABC transporter permease [Clostridia bacterium]|nr:carbohydrate ABC transporter permease [Clostridia bacterium]